MAAEPREGVAETRPPLGAPEGSEPPPPESEGPEAPPPGVRAMATLRWAILAGVAAVALLSFWFLLAPEGAANVKYTCPMVEHAFVVKDEPGECPVCHMELVPMPAEAAEARKQGAAAAAAELPPDTPPGLVPIHVELGRAQKIGVRTALVEEADAGSGLRAPAYVSAPESGASQAHVRAPGFVERVAVGQTGVAVGAGQPLVYVYSPDIYRAQEEMLAIRRFEGVGPGGGTPAGPTLEAARRRLELYGLTAKDIDDIVRKGAPERAVPVRSPASGHVTRKEVALGAYVTPEMVLYEIADLSRVYVVADVFTRDAASLRVGSAGLVRFASLPGPEIKAKIDLIYPEMNAAARTTRVRLQVPNPGLLLRPGLYGEVRFETGARRALVVPRDAVVDTGESRYVFVDLGEGRYAPRLVTLGAEAGERVEIVSGLRAGERVVSGATFLLDSESRLQAALTGVVAPPASAGTASPHASAPPPASPPAPTAAPSSPTPPAAAPSLPTPPPAAAPAPEPAQYTCPMHPEVLSDSPGRCPKCGMPLEPKAAGGAR
ncbi:MAG TPA: efflux RND transporter periplasmic adaptor subunit [Polyangiaceae bacterium]|nr:efflux RND transporter periplasmic adaptor subunit [Polyangiaceae bacterium]